jgi:hypothetical protein
MNVDKTLREQMAEFLVEFDAKLAKRGTKRLTSGTRLSTSVPSVNHTLSESERAAKLEEYKAKLARFGRYFERSDDPTVYRKGKAQFDELVALRRLVDPQFEVWDDFFEGKTRY